MPDDCFFVASALGVKGHARVIAAAAGLQRGEDLAVEHRLPVGGNLLCDRQPADLVAKTQADSLIDQEPGRTEFVQRSLPIGEQARVDPQAHERGRLEYLPGRVAEPPGTREDRVTRR